MPKTMRIRNQLHTEKCYLFFTFIFLLATADNINNYIREGNENSPVILPFYYHYPNKKENNPHLFWNENTPLPHFHSGQPTDFKLHQHFSSTDSDFPKVSKYVSDPPGIGINKNASTFLV